MQFVCVRSWGRHVYDSGSRECVCVYICVCGVLMVNKKPYKPTSPPTRLPETKVKTVGPGVSSKKHVAQLVYVASWCRREVYNYGRATASNIVMSVSVSGFVAKKGSRGWNERMPSSPNTESPCGSDLFMIQPISSSTCCWCTPVSWEL